MEQIIITPDILLPNATADLSKWATVACDQFTAEPAYWNKLASFVGDAPSTLKLVIPEIYLHDHVEARAKAVCREMNHYLKTGFFREHHGMVLVEREITGGQKRVGLVLAVDLEQYDWRRIRVPLRATEDTILARLPARVDIRRCAALELPHILLLVDDDKREIIESLYAGRTSFDKLYDFDLNMDGGHITGYAVPDSDKVIGQLNALLDPKIQKEKYGVDAGILFAIGDGNHSMAAAKSYWEELKPTLTPEERLTHPARYILAELVNLYGGGMEFQPIHRLVTGADPEAFLDGLKTALGGSGSLGILDKEGKRTIAAPQNPAETIRKTQIMIEAYLSGHPAARVEYVHNLAHLEEAVGESGGIGIVMPAFPAEKLFDYVVNVGNLPKKAFSVGEPEDKRYYLEAKKIVL